MLRYGLVLAGFLITTDAMARDRCEGTFCLQQKVRMSCLKPEMRGVLDRLSQRIGRIEITSVCDGRHARRSHHYVGRAVDFRPMDTTVRVAVHHLRAMPEVGGIGTYGSGLVHADVGPLRHAWHRGGRTKISSSRARLQRLARR